MATMHDKYGLAAVVNAAGTFTALGVSRSSPEVSRAAGDALREFFVIDELQQAASEALARLTGAEAGAVTHCVSAAITLSVAAAMMGDAPDRVAALPDVGGAPNRVVLPAGHAVNYGHSILQDIRLAGGVPAIAGTTSACSAADIEAALADPAVACLLLVSSRLVAGPPLDMAACVRVAHARGVPAIIDGAAQDLRISELLATGADLVLVSAHKYMAAPTAGLIVGRKDLVAAVRAHEKGIGRAMKASKEAICGVLAAIEERERLDIRAWSAAQAEKVRQFVERAAGIPGIAATAVADPAGMPFSRVHLAVDPSRCGIDAVAAAQRLQASTPSVWVMPHRLDKGEIVLELVPLDQREIDTLLDCLSNVMRAARGTQA
jgi:L-seryl-tRNA(Ser) seleniumtransferase